MKLWLLERTNEVGYDEYDAVVVRARSEVEARSIVQNARYYQGAWASDENVKCTQLTAKGTAEIILGSFNAG
jgi:serine protease inhibitor